VREVTAGEFRRQLDALGADYRDRLPEKVAAIRCLWRDLMNGILPPAALTDLRRELHTLAGSARTFGVARVSELAAAAEMVIEPFWEQDSLPDPAGAAELTRLLDALNRPAGDV
jgi:HPt (histidine-containing phosphotransfer) domain-containing protein